MKLHLPSEVLMPKLRAILQRVADDANAAIVVTTEGVAVEMDHKPAPKRHHKITDYQEAADEAAA